MDQSKVARLIDEYVQAAQVAESMRLKSVKKGNRAVAKMHSIADALGAHAQGGCSQFDSLLSHPDPVVRYSAAAELLLERPIVAYPVLKKLSELTDRSLLQSMAELMIRAFEAGRLPVNSPHPSDDGGGK